MKISTIFIILTPFQYKMMELIFKEEMFSSSTILFHTKNVKIKKGKHKGIFREIYFAPFSMHVLASKPFQTLFGYRKTIKKIGDYSKYFVDSVTVRDTLKVIIGTDKDNFTQILLNQLYASKKFNIELNAVEEGLGFYLNEGKVDKFKAFLYKVLTPILFGELIQYHRQLGTDSRINYVYARMPHLISKHKNANPKEIYKIEREITNVMPLKETTGKILIFSFPNQDYAIDDLQKKRIFHTLMNRLAKDRVIYIKPHPRESTKIFEEIKEINIISKEMVGEDLDYFEYDKVINFSSSVIIDLLYQNYPKERIYTIKIKSINFSFFDETNCLRLSELKNYNFED